MSKKYVFNLSKIQYGDILFSSTSAKDSRLIARATGGDFSHAMLGVGNSVIHAMPDGVYSKNPQRFIFDKPEHFCVMRLREKPSDAVIFKAINHARKWVGGLYSKIEAGKSVILHQTETAAKSPKQYCSKLVAECYEEAGIKLVLNAGYCTPHDLTLSELLIDVPDYFREATVADIAYIESFDPNLPIQRETFTWLENLRVLAKEREAHTVLHMDDVVPFLLLYPSHDKAVCKFVNQTLYLYLYDIDRKINPWRYDEHVFLSALKGLAFTEIKRILSREYDINEPDLERRESNVKNARNNLQRMPLDYFKLDLAHAQNLYNENYRRVEVLNNVSRRFGLQRADVPAN
ncbi:YiiX/YebB-like N1pC/P60 family cysteine hydrolase [Herbaspirillum seropedicae]|uniref:YiiX/YebB-like N1pC/P60 family cysteine hydrolase n=1 Tax=Herbaspirillum seropedicae TaxID=964 RepID=UPI002856ED7A|nr:YiiX/YebB-like N1pC/P60 family cysteine hydrolase [Herbaspirillum seropedicae]MDR6398522.1 hypothetical protein [Herbaspirillum seropedicae]